ncbi:MAG: hypothetical protein NZM38_07150 [Cytophagales bacterium]|nr:hypothetical protein [Cytophagales bacterium]MDW8384533.1 hypothetical protein [Flammeovirgaceae bacterium]
MSRTIHQVSVQKTKGGFNLMTVEEFMEIPALERMELAFKKKVTFLDENGEIIPPAEGMKILTEMFKNKK